MGSKLKAIFQVDETYERYQIKTKKAYNLLPHPHRFSVKVNKFELSKLLIKEFFHYRGRFDVISSRPCVYGVFSGPIGGFAPREKLCVGCMRCTTQYPKVVKILPNPKREEMGDAFLTPEIVDTIIYEAETGRIPVKGAGYRGKFGGKGWDSMWTDMSEIVRPTRDGIHGREYISTEVDIGYKPSFLQFDEQNLAIGPIPETATIQIPILFHYDDSLKNDETFCRILTESALHSKTFALLPFESIKRFALRNSSVIPSLKPDEVEGFQNLRMEPLLIQLEGWNETAYRKLKSSFPNAQIILKISFSDELNSSFEAGVRIFHLTADAHGYCGEKFVLDHIRNTHLNFVKKGCRGEVSLIGNGGIIAAEHVPKAIICGLDAVALNLPLLVALQAKLQSKQGWQLPKEASISWGTQRLLNLVGSWRDQLLEILGAMGIREVRRLRGEMGRAMFQKDLEAEAFQGIVGYEAG